MLGALIEDPVPLRLEDVGRHPRSYGFPRGHPPMRTFLGAPILVRGLPYGNLYLTEKAGGAQFSAEDEEALMVLAELAGVAIDHARRYTGASERRDELERTVAALDATTQIALAVGGETDLDVILELVAKRGRALVGARVLLIELRRPPGARRRRRRRGAARGRDRPHHPAARLARRAGAARAPHAAPRRRSQPRPLREHGTGRLGVDAQGGLVVPLLFRGHGYGALLALDRLQDGPSFSAEDERLLVAFAASAATAVATAQSVASERQRQRLAAAEAERRRWARELHDDTLQSLSALRIGLSTAARSERPEALRDAFAKAIEQLEESITNLRALITDLRPAALDELGTQAAVEALAERTTRHGIEVDVSIDLAYEQSGSRGEGERRSRATPPSSRPRSTGSCRRRSPTPPSMAARSAPSSRSTRTQTRCTSRCATTAPASTPPPTPRASACSGCASASSCSTARCRSTPPRAPAPPCAPASPSSGGRSPPRPPYAIRGG